MHLWTHLRLSAALIFYATVGLQAAAASSSALDPALEAELDAIIEVGFYPPDRETFESILARVDADSTPIESYVRTKA